MIVCSAGYLATSLAGVSIGKIIPVVALTLVAYFIFRLKERTHSFADYGLRTDNLRSATPWIGGFTLCAAVGIVIWGAAHSRSPFRSEIAVMMLLYPLWGTAQQLIFQELLHRGLLVLLPSRWLAIFVHSILFAAVHIPHWEITALVFPVALAWSWLYQRHPNVWLLGVSHGWLAALSYVLILDENPLMRFW